MECFENGILGRGQLGGIGLEWGDHAAMVQITESIARGEGPAAELLGDGTAAAVQRLGLKAADYAMTCGGEELGMHDPRCWPGIATSYVADATPGRHTQAGAWFIESGFLPPDGSYPDMPDRYTYAGKGEHHKNISNLHHALSQAGLCQFSLPLLPASVIPRYLSLASGHEFSMDEVLEIGERAANLRIAFNLREGIHNKETYCMPSRTLGRPPLAGGATKGITVDDETERADYYGAMGWDVETGVPKREVLQRLGLEFAIGACEKPLGREATASS